MAAVEQRLFVAEHSEMLGAGLLGGAGGLRCGAGRQAAFKEGRAVISACLLWKANMGIAAAMHARTKRITYRRCVIRTRSSF